MVTFINGEFVEEKSAALHVSDLSIQRGYALFDFFRTSNHIPVFLDDYLNRFFRSAEGLRLPVSYTQEQIKNFIYQLNDKNNIPEAGFRMLLTGGYSNDGYQPADPNFIVIQQPLSMPDSLKIEKGLSLILHEYLRELPKVKSTNYLLGIWLQQKINDKKADDVLYTKDDAVLECPRSNIFIVTKQNVVVTPNDNVLDGITRMKLIALAARKYKVETRAISLAELFDAKEVFLTSTTKRLYPVLRIEDKLIANGKAGAITLKLLKDFLELEEAYCKQVVSGE